jgi:prevent-host-death family protein
MAMASISEAKAKLSALLDRVKAGETVTITDRGVPVAQIVPLNGSSEVDWDARMESLERRGIIRRPKQNLDMRAFLADHPPVKFEGSVLEALLEERRESDR